MTRAGLVLLAAIAAAAAGCTSPRELVTATVRFQVGTNVVEVQQPKDTTIDRLELDPVSGRFVLVGYASAANAAAIRAQAEQAAASAAVFRDGVQLLRAGVDAYMSRTAPTFPLLPVPMGASPGNSATGVVAVVSQPAAATNFPAPSRP